MRLVDAILLAGGKQDAVAQAEGVPVKAAIRLDGETMLSRVLKALMGALTVRHISVVAPEIIASLISSKTEANSLRELKPVQFVAQGDSLWENIQRGIEALAQAEKEAQATTSARCEGAAPVDLLLFVSADTPLLTGATMDEFVRLAMLTEADVVYPIVAREVIESRFPNASRTYVTIRDGCFSGGNLMLVRRRVIQEHAGLIREVLEARKKPWKLCKMLGVWFMLLLGLKRLTLKRIEERASQILRCRACALIVTAPEIAFDVDKPEDLAIVRRILTAYLD